MPDIITSGNHSFVLSESTTAVAMNAFTALPSIMARLFNMTPSASPSETYASLSGLGQLQLKGSTQNTSRDATQQQFSKTFTHDEYALAVDVERKYSDDENFGHFARLGNMLGNSTQRTFEAKAAGVFNNAFGTQLAEDGLSLCNDAHLNRAGGNSQDNSGTNSLTYAGWKTTRIAHRKFTDYRGEKILIMPTMLLVPVDLEEDAAQIEQAAQKPGSNNNDVNFFSGVETVVWEYLSDVNSWFSIDPMLMRQNLHWFQRIAVEFFGNRDWDSMVASTGVYTRFSYGPQDWRWVYGNNPS